MAFIVSKVFVFLISPLNWVAALLVYGLLARNDRWRRTAFVAAALATLLLTNPFLTRLAWKLWERAPVAIAEIREPYDVGIVLGGFARPQAEPRDRLHLSENSERLIHAIELYRQGKIRKILITGGAHNIFGENVTEGSVTGAFLLRMGIPDDDFIIEDSSRNTRENAVYTIQLLEEQMPHARCLLITSAFHMRRAIACFHKRGLEVTPFATDVRARPLGLNPQQWILPDPMAFENWRLLVKEWFGFVVYRIRGWA